jgi:hypothetical protein
VFDELSGTGLSNALAKFSASVQEVAKNPVSPEFRTNLVQTAQILTETFNHAASQLLDKQADLDQTIAAQVLQVNDIAVTLADYNGQIAAMSCLASGRMICATSAMPCSTNCPVWSSSLRPNQPLVSCVSFSATAVTTANCS